MTEDLFSVYTVSNVVHLDFNEPDVPSMSITPDDAEDLAVQLIKNAKKAREWGYS